MNQSTRLLQLSCSLVLLCGICIGEQIPQSFASVDAAFRRNRLQWTAASGPFQTMRAQLGESFEPELWKYLGTNTDRADSIANFLVVSDYLHAYPPMPDLALRIRLKTLSQASGKSDLSSRIAFVTASINAAVESAELELIGEARQHRADADKMLAADKFMAAGVPAMDDYDRCVYESLRDAKIASPATACLAKKTADDSRVTMIEIGEIAQDKILAKPAPKWPKSMAGGVSGGAFKVRIVIDESGKVESAEGWSGPANLLEAAIAAAREARFQKTLYEGNPVKVLGWLVYAY